ncbi:MAG: pyruvate kinase [Bacteroidales bacterium]
MDTKARIVASIGPSSNDKEVLREMIKSGMRVARLNFSHGSYQGKTEVVTMLRDLQDELNINLTIIGDLQGPKLRLGMLPEYGIQVTKGDKITFTTDEEQSGDKRFFVNYPAFAKDVNEGDIILIDDGKIKLCATNSNNMDAVTAEVISGGTFYSRKGINLPDTVLSLPALTAKDKDDITFAVENNFDWLALSFVRKKEDIEELRSYVGGLYGKSRIIAKIEKPEAVLDISDIIKASDGIMVARGDLGVEIDFKKVPVIQKAIVKECIREAKPVIIATQMLDSMITNFRPTRAEANDVANAVLDLADGLMLSGETAIGKYPVESVSSMSSIIQHTEAEGINYSPNHAPKEGYNEFIPDSVCYNAYKMAEQTCAKAIILFTHSGYTAFRISSHRPKANMYAFTWNKKLLKRLPLLWGMNAYYMADFDDIDNAIDFSISVLKKKGLLEKGDKVIHVGSTPLTSKASTNMIKLSQVE